MRKLDVITIIMLVIISGITDCAFSAGKKPTAKKCFIEKYLQRLQAAGSVARVDTGRPAIIISTQDNKSLFLIVNSETRLLKDGKTISISEIKKGNSVRADYEMAYRDKNIARSVNVEPSETGVP